MASPENVVVKIDNEALQKLVGKELDSKSLNSGLRAFALWVQGEVNEKAPIKTGTLQSSTIVDDPEYHSTIVNKRGDSISSEKTGELQFQVRQAVEYAQSVFEKGSHSGDAKILLTAGTNKEKFIEKFTKGFQDAKKNG